MQLHLLDMKASSGTLLIIEQLNELLERLDKAAYTLGLPLFHGSSIGQHVRHIVEFYVCLLEGRPSAHIDYGSRKRNNELSESPAAALAALEHIAGSARQLDEHQWLNVESEFSGDAGDERPAYISSMGRELQYAFDHAVHHLAIIRMGMEIHFPEIPVDPDLGVAPSTLKYRNGGKSKKTRKEIPETMYG